MTYPYDLVFELPITDSRRVAITRAASILNLRTSSDDSTVRVTVLSPIECYRLGQKTGGFLDGDPAPKPVQNRSDAVS
jgi:hypothetical protein